MRGVARKGPFLVRYLYNAIMAYLMDIPDSELPEDLVAAFDAIEAAWHLADGTKPER